MRQTLGIVWKKYLCRLFSFVWKSLIYILLLEKLCANLHYRCLRFSYRFGEPCIVQQCQLTGRIKEIITMPEFLQIAGLNVLFFNHSNLISLISRDFVGFCGL